MKAVNEKAMAARGWAWQKAPGDKAALKRKKVDGMRCTWCSVEVDEDDWADNHSFCKCPNRAQAEVEYAVRKNEYMLKHNATHLLYTIPSPTTKGAPVSVCKGTFCNVMGLHTNSKKLKSLHQRDQTTAVPTPPTMGRITGWNDVQKNCFGQHLKRYPRSTGHYSTKAQDKQRYFQDESLNRVHIWKDWCYIHDHAFWVQANRVNFWRTYDTLQYKPNPSEQLLKPKLSYTTARVWLAEYDVSFKCLSIDTCDSCDRLRIILADANTTATMVDDCMKKLHAHLTKADECYAKRTAHIKTTKDDYKWGSLPIHGRSMGEIVDMNSCCSQIEFMSKDRTETQIQDAFGNLRTPRMSSGEAYYLRILPVWVYDFYSAATETHYLYSWNEEIGHKGVNNIVSAEYHHHTHHRTGAVRLKKWMDGCYAQANNKTMMKYNIHITDPDGPMQIYERVDEHVCISGHSYLICDSACGNVQSKARSKKIISDKDDWEEIMRTANDAHPHCVIQFLQPMHRNWKKYLAQYYVGSRIAEDELDMRISKARWRNYGVGELWVENEEHPHGGFWQIVKHPGEVWVRYGNDPKETPQRLDLRRNCATKFRYNNPAPLVASLSTSALPPLTTPPKPIEDDCWLLYTNGKLPITKEKKQDLRKLAKHCPKEKRAQYRYRDAGPDDVTDDEGGATEDEHEHEPSEDDDSDDENAGGSSTAT